MTAPARHRRTRAVALAIALITAPVLAACSAGSPALPPITAPGPA